MEHFKLRNLTVLTDGKMMFELKRSIFLFLVGITFLLQIICLNDLGVIQANKPMLTQALRGSYFLLLLYTITLWLLSRYSPSKTLRIRKKLILFTHQFTKMVDDGIFKKSVQWHYIFVNNVDGVKKMLVIEVFPNGLEKDLRLLGMKLSQYLRLELLNYAESDNKACFFYGKPPKRLNGMEVLLDEEL